MASSVNIEDIALPVLLIGGAYLWWRQSSGTSNGSSDSTTTDDVTTIGQQVNTAVSQISNNIEGVVTGRTRGERNNNPGNIIRNTPQTQWQGLSPTQTDSTFVQFTSAVYGIRALCVNLLAYYNNHGYNTVRSIITHWSATDQSAYVANVSSALGVTPDTVINVNDPTTLTNLAHAIILQENGEDIYQSSGVLAQGVSAALGS